MKNHHISSPTRSMCAFPLPPSPRTSPPSLYTNIYHPRHLSAIESGRKGGRLRKLTIFRAPSWSKNCLVPPSKPASPSLARAASRGMPPARGIRPLVNCRVPHMHTIASSTSYLLCLVEQLAAHSAAGMALRIPSGLARWWHFFQMLSF